LNALVFKVVNQNGDWQSTFELTVPRTIRCEIRHRADKGRGVASPGMMPIDH